MTVLRSAFYVLPSTFRLCLTSGVRDDTRDLVNAYANQGLQPEDFTGVKPREELLIRFPVGSLDMGLMSAMPRERPPEQPRPDVVTTPVLPALQPATPEETLDLVTLEALERGVTETLQARPDLLPETVYRAVGNEWVAAMHQEIAAGLVVEGQATRVEQVSEQAWAAVDALVRRLRAVSERRAQTWTEALFERQRTLPADEHLSLLSQYRYGVHPVINACYVAALVHRYPTDELAMAQHERQRRQGGRAEQPGADNRSSPTRRG